MKRPFAPHIGEFWMHHLHRTLRQMCMHHSMRKCVHCCFDPFYSICVYTHDTHAPTTHTTNTRIHTRAHTRRDFVRANGHHARLTARCSSAPRALADHRLAWILPLASRGVSLSNVRVKPLLPQCDVLTRAARDLRTMVGVEFM